MEMWLRRRPRVAFLAGLGAVACSHTGPIATPDYLQWAPGLPKPRSGKIMRRILRKIGENLPDQLGDISTLADPGVVKSLVDERLIK